MRLAPALVLLLSGWAGSATPAHAQPPLEATVNGSTQALREIMNVPLKSVPEALLRESHGIAIVPGMVKGGFIVGVQHGRGVLLTRDEAGLWRAPVFITVTDASVGAQVGVQSTDLVLMFKTRRSVEGMLRGKLTFGADLAVAAGPVGRQAAAATDAQLKAEILSYSRSRGLFAGVALDGATIHLDHKSTGEYYALRPGQLQPGVPASAVALAQLVTSYAPPHGAVVMAPPQEPLPPPPIQPPEEREAVRQQLVAAAQHLQAMLDPAWQQYLALPTEVFTGHPLAPASLEMSLRHYQVVASEPRYRELSENHEFQETHALLRRFAALAGPHPTGTLPLPPPPEH